jgi:antitoxin PrlF
MKTTEVNSALTERYQTTVPEPVRRALNLQKRDRIKFQILANGTVVLAKAELEDEEDPAIGAFLNFLERDLLTYPGSLNPLTSERIAELKALTKGIEFDINAPLDSADD